MSAGGWKSGSSQGLVNVQAPPKVTIHSESDVNARNPRTSSGLRGGPAAAV
jgi:hypothetical protein